MTLYNFIYIYIYTHTHAQIRTRTHAHTHTHTHACTHMLPYQPCCVVLYKTVSSKGMYGMIYYIYLYIYIYIFLYIGLYICVCVYVCVTLCVRVCVGVCVCICGHVSIIFYCQFLTPNHVTAMGTSIRSPMSSAVICHIQCFSMLDEMMTALFDHCCFNVET